MSSARGRTVVRAATNRRPGVAPASARAAAPRRDRRPRYEPRLRPVRGPHRRSRFLLVDQARRLPGFRSAPPSTYREGMRSQTLLLPHVSRPVRGQDSPVSTSGSSWPIASNDALFLETIADAVQRLNHIEIVVAGLEFLAQPLDVAVDGP